MLQFNKLMPFTNRKWFKNTKLFVMSAILIGGSLFCALHDFSNDVRPRSNIVAHTVGWLGIGFFGYVVIFMLYKNIKYALQGRGMVDITDKGLFVRDEFVAWETIVGIHGNKYYLIIDTNDTKERLLRASWWSRLRYRMVGAMITVSNFDYDGSQEEYVAILKQQIERMLRQISVESAHETKRVRNIKVSDRIKSLSAVPASSSTADYKDDIIEMKPSK